MKPVERRIHHLAARDEVEHGGDARKCDHDEKTKRDDLLDAVRDLPKWAKYLHVPAQSGSNRILGRMKRGYTIEDYREMMDRIRVRIPDAAVTSDFIVGFCGETEDDFQLTVELVREQRFKNSFIFKYSERPGTRGADR